MSDHLEKICYKSNFLKNVIFRVDFLNLLKSIESEIPASLYDKIISYFPIPEPRETQSTGIKLKTMEQPEVIENRKFMEWHFYGRNRNKHLAIFDKSIFIEHKKYDRYEEFKDMFFNIFEELLNSNPNANASRIGLRYINAITLEENNVLNWESYINSDLLSTFNFSTDEDKNKLARVFHNIEYNFDDFMINFRFGMHNADYPAPIIKKVFVLDFDAYYQGKIEPKEIAESIDTHHSKIQELFEMCITDKLREVMDG